jgi:hypothetical protein
VITRAATERDLVIVACAVSAGIHAALVPDHLAEGTAAGAAFAIAAVLLAAVAVALTRVVSTAALTAAVALFAGLIVSYGLAVTAGLPVLHPHPEAVDGLAVFTKAVELLGLLAAAHLLSRRQPALARGISRLAPIPLGLTALIAVFTVLASLAVSSGHMAH